VSGREAVDVVDDRDHVLRVATRAQVRAENLLHRACYVVALDANDRIFVHLRTATKDVFPSHFDVTVGGVLAAGEAYDDAARREVEEELGVRPRDLRNVGSLRYEDAGNRVIGRVYECRVEPPLRLQQDEIASGEWLVNAAVDRQLRTLPFCPDGVVAFDVWRRSRRDQST
jgi:isopentenyldiphosphate isomerase